MNHDMSPAGTNLVARLLLSPSKYAPVIYLSGPITGYEDLNKPAFDNMEARLFEKIQPTVPKLEIVNPLKVVPPDQQAGKNWQDFMRIDLAELVKRATLVVMLPNWRESRGAVTEFILAKILHIPVFGPDLTPIHPTAYDLRSIMDNFTGPIQDQDQKDRIFYSQLLNYQIK